MNPRKIKPLVIVLLFSAWVLACGSENAFDQQVAVVVALTQTAVALQQPSATSALPLASPEATIVPTDTFVPLPTSTPAVASSPSYQPLSAEECNALQVALAQSVGFPGNIQDPSAVHGLYQSEERHRLFGELLADFRPGSKFDG